MDGTNKKKIVKLQMEIKHINNYTPIKRQKLSYLGRKVRPNYMLSIRDML